MKNNIWSEVTLEEYTQIREILDDKSKDKEDMLISLAAVLQGVDEDTILNMPLDKVEPIFEMVQGLAQKPKANRVCRKYNLGEWRLRVSDRQMCLAQWIDFQNFAREGYESHLADILSVVLVPEGHSYNNGYDLDRLKADLKKMTVGDALAVCFFFQRRYLKSTRRILSCLIGWMSLKGMKEERKRCLALRKEVSAILASL